MCKHAGEFTIRAKKATAGEHFAGLDLVTELLRPPGRGTTRPLVEVVGDDGTFSAASMPNALSLL